MWAVVEKYKVSKFYTAPTAIRMLMKYSDDFVKKYNMFNIKNETKILTFGHTIFLQIYSLFSVKTILV